MELLFFCCYVISLNDDVFFNDIGVRIIVVSVLILVC